MNSEFWAEQKRGDNEAHILLSDCWKPIPKKLMRIPQHVIRDSRHIWEPNQVSYFKFIAGLSPTHLIVLKMFTIQE